MHLYLILFLLTSVPATQDMDRMLPTVGPEPSTNGQTYNERQ